MLSRNVLHVMGMGCGREKEGKKKTRGKEASEEKKEEESKGKEPGGKERREATPSSLYTSPPPDRPPLAEITGELKRILCFFSHAPSALNAAYLVTPYPVSNPIRLT